MEWVDEGDRMLDDKELHFIQKFQKFAKRNLILKYFIAFLLFLIFSINNLLKKHRKGILIGTVTCFSCLFFLSVIVRYGSFPIQKKLDENVLEEQSLIVSEEVKDATVLLAEEVTLDQKSAGTDQQEIVAVENGYEEYSAFHKTDWNLILINKNHPIPEDYHFTLGTIKGNKRCDERIIEPLTTMFTNAKEDGVNLIVCSPYRDMERQSYLFERKVKNYIRKGMSYLEAYQKSSETVTVPGASEHEVGLAIDIISDDYCKLDEGFADTDAGKWLAKHSYEYGFILRYPKDKEEVTGIQYEPWHFRYVGEDAAKIMANKNMTLEEFVDVIS